MSNLCMVDSDAVGAYELLIIQREHFISNTSDHRRRIFHCIHQQQLHTRTYTHSRYYNSSSST